MAVSTRRAISFLCFFQSRNAAAVDGLVLHSRGCDSRQTFFAAVCMVRYLSLLPHGASGGSILSLAKEKE